MSTLTIINILLITFVDHIVLIKCILCNKIIKFKIQLRIMTGFWYFGFCQVESIVYIDINLNSMISYLTISFEINSKRRRTMVSYNL